DLGVCLTAEDVAGAFEARPQRTEVLDDAVVDDREAAGAVEVGMGVLVANATVRCPAGMAEADAGLRERDRRVADLSCPLGHLNMAVDCDADPPRVVTAILQAPQRVEDHQPGVTLRADVTEDSAHSIVCPFPCLAEGRRPPNRAARIQSRTEQCWLTPGGRETGQMYAHRASLCAADHSAVLP